MDRDQLRATVLGFVATFAVLGILLHFVGVEDLLQELQAADTLDVVGVFVLTLGWLACWSMALRTVLGVLGVDIKSWKAFLVFSGAMFSNNITPFGQAGGEPVTALLISKSSDAEYETGLAAIASVDTLNFVPSITLALVGAAYFATEVTFGRDLRIATGAVVVLALAVPGLVYVGWQNRYELEPRVVRIFTPIIQRFAGIVPGVSSPSTESIEQRINRFFGAIERVATNPRGLVTALAFSSAGWLCQMIALWLAFVAIDVSVPLSVMLFIVPMAAIAGITPLPGGAGGVEWALLFLLLAAPIGLSEPAALAAIVIFRGLIYWTPIVIGGAVVGVVGANGKV